MNGLEGWVLAYLVNALWQAPVVFCAAWAMTQPVHRAGAKMIHRIWVSALLAEATLPACPTWIGERVREFWAAWTGWSSGADGGQIRVRFGDGLAATSGRVRLPASAWAAIAAAYGATVLYFAARLAWGLWRTRQMRLRAKPMPAPWRQHPNGPDSSLVRSSADVAGPVTVGAWHAMVLLPLGFAERVTGEDLRAVLAHEEAHVRRRDFAKNALYSLLTLPVAFHPALWLTRARLAQSREMVCDAMAAEAVAGRERYVGSLLRLASMRFEGLPEKMLHAIGIFGIFDANSFERRVMNLTTGRSEMTWVRRAALAAGCGVLGLATCATALALRIGVPGQSEARVPAVLRAALGAPSKARARVRAPPRAPAKVEATADRRRRRRAFPAV